MKFQQVTSRTSWAIGIVAVGLMTASIAVGQVDEPAPNGNRSAESQSQADEGAQEKEGAQANEGDRDRQPVDDQRKKPGDRRALSKNWIGVALAGEGELTVVDVSPDGPADAAGLREGDVIVAFDEQPLKNVSELVAAIDAARRQPTAVKIRRGGEELTLKVQPERRPADRGAWRQLPFHPGEPLDVDKLREMIQKWREEGGPLPAEQVLEWYRLRPGVVVPQNRERFGQFPKQTSVTVTRGEDDQLEIRVEHDGKTYEVTDREVGELPQALRRTVQQMLGGPLWPSIVIEPTVPGAVPRIEIPRAPRVQPPSRARAATDDQAERLDELQREVEALRRDVWNLKKERNARAE